MCDAKVSVPVRASCPVSRPDADGKSLGGREHSQRALLERVERFVHETCRAYPRVLDAACCEDQRLLATVVQRVLRARPGTAEAPCSCYFRRRAS